MVAELMAAKDVAIVLGLSKAQAYALASEGTLPSVRIGRSVRFPIADIQRIAREGVPVTNGQDA